MKQKSKISHIPTFILLILTVIVLCIDLSACFANTINFPTVTLGVQEAETPEQFSTALQIIFLLTILSVAPSIILMMTCFTRIIIVFGFVRMAMSTQSMPPTQVLMALALFLTFYVMSPTLNEINEKALTPYLNEEISQQAAFGEALVHMRAFMFEHVHEEELKLLTDITLDNEPFDQDAIPTLTLIPAFMLSELKRAFQMGFLIYIPFLVIDMIVASILMSMGMMMLPPVIISMPFKLLLFVLVDGWALVVGSVLKSLG